MKKCLFQVLLLGFAVVSVSQMPVMAQGSDFMSGKSFITSALGASQNASVNQGWNLFAPFEVRRTPDRMPTSEEFLQEKIEGVTFADWKKSSRATYVCLLEPKPLLLDVTGGVMATGGGLADKIIWNEKSHPQKSDFNLVLRRKMLNTNYNEASPTEPKYVYEFAHPTDSTVPRKCFVYKDVEYKWEFQKSFEAPEKEVIVKHTWDYDCAEHHDFKTISDPGVQKLISSPWDPGVSHDGDTVDIASVEKALFHVYVTLKYKRAEAILGASTESTCAISSIEGYTESAPGNDLWVGGDLSDKATCTWGAGYPTYKDMFGATPKSGVSVTYVEDYTPPELMVTLGAEGDMSMKGRTLSGTDVNVNTRDDNPNNPATQISFEYAISTKEVYYDDLNGDGNADPINERFIYVSKNSSSNPSDRDGYFGAPAPAATSFATSPKRMRLSQAERAKALAAIGGNGSVTWKDGSYWISPPSMNTSISGADASFDADGIILPAHASQESGDGIETKKTTVSASNCCGNVSKTTTGSIKPHDDIKPNIGLTVGPSGVQDFAYKPDDDKHGIEGGEQSADERDVFLAKDYFIPNGDTIPTDAACTPASSQVVPGADGKIVDATGHEFGRWTNDDDAWDPADGYKDKNGNNMLEASGLFRPTTKKRVKFVVHAVDNLDRWDVTNMRSYITKKELDIVDENGVRPMGFEPVVWQPDSQDVNGASVMQPLEVTYQFRKPGVYTVSLSAEDTVGNKRVMKVKVPVIETHMSSSTIGSQN